MIRRSLPFLQLLVSLLILFAILNKDGNKIYDTDVRFSVEEYYLAEVKVSIYAITDLKTGKEHLIFK